MYTNPKSQSKTPPPKHRISLCEFQLLYHRLDPTNNGIRSAALAGFKGSPASLAVQASRTLRKARECGFLATVLNEHGCTLERAAERLSACLSAKRKRAFLVNDGTVLYAEPEEDYGIQMRALEFVLKLHGAFDSKRQEEVLLAEVADAMGLVEQEQPADTTSEVAHDEELSHLAAPENEAGDDKNSSAGEALAHSEAGSEPGGTGTTPRPDSTSVLPKMGDGNDVAEQTDPETVLAQLLLDAQLELKRTHDGTDRTKLREEICRIAMALHKVRSRSEIKECWENWDGSLSDNSTSDGQGGGAATATPAMPDAVEQALAKLTPAEYDHGLRLFRDLYEYMDLRAQLAADPADKEKLDGQT